MTLGVWLLSLALAAPPSFYTRYLDLRPSGIDLVVCEEFWPNSGNLRLLYSCFILATSYMIPLLSVSISYCAITVSLKRYSVPGEPSSSQQRWSQRRKKTFTLLVASVLAFALCWLPLQVITKQAKAENKQLATWCLPVFTVYYYYVFIYLLRPFLSDSAECQETKFPFYFYLHQPANDKHNSREEAKNETFIVGEIRFSASFMTESHVGIIQSANPTLFSQWAMKTKRLGFHYYKDYGEDEVTQRSGWWEHHFKVTLVMLQSLPGEKDSFHNNSGDPCSLQTHFQSC